MVCSLRNDEIAKDEVLASTKSTSDGYDEKYETVHQTCATPDIYSTELIIKLGKK
ncbi:MAG: hypothetical protein K6A43_06815 [Treponema sp.]|nr:hypothetical protein [Treponema sp.]